MPNGSKGDEPWTDMLSYGEHPFPPDIEALVRELLALDPTFFRNITRSTLEEYGYWQQSLAAWSRGENYDEGRQSLKAAIESLRASKE